MDARHLIDEDADEREDDNTDAVARDAPAADENAEEHDPEDLAYERPDEDADEDGNEADGPSDTSEVATTGARMRRRTSTSIILMICTLTTRLSDTVS